MINMESNRILYKNVLEELDKDIENTESISYDIDISKTLHMIILRSVIESIQKGELYPYEEFKSLSIDLQSKLFILFDKEYKTIELAEKWGVNEGIVYQWRHRVKKYISENSIDFITTLKQELALLKYSNEDKLGDRLDSFFSNESNIESNSNLQRNKNEIKDEKIEFTISKDLIKVNKLDSSPSQVLKILEYIQELNNLDTNNTYDIYIDIRKRK